MNAVTFVWPLSGRVDNLVNVSINGQTGEFLPGFCMLEISLSEHQLNEHRTFRVATSVDTSHILKRS